MDAKFLKLYNKTIPRLEWAKTTAKRRVPAQWRKYLRRWYSVSYVRLAIQCLSRMDGSGTGSNTLFICAGDGYAMPMALTVAAIAKRHSVHIVCVDPKYSEDDHPLVTRRFAKSIAACKKRTTRTGAQRVPLGIEEWLTQATATGEWRNMRNVVVLAHGCHAPINTMANKFKRCFTGAHTLLVAITPCCKYSSIMPRRKPVFAVKPNKWANAKCKRLDTRIYKL